MRPLKVGLLWIFLYAFIARVIGQVYVGLYPNEGISSYLPVWESWYSGLLPYPYLLISQIIIIQVMTLMSYDYSRSHGLFCLKSKSVKTTIRIFALFYFSLMIVRLVFFDQTHLIPIFFHCVLASFLYVYSFPNNQKA